MTRPRWRGAKFLRSARIYPPPGTGFGASAVSQWKQAAEKIDVIEINCRYFDNMPPISGTFARRAVAAVAESVPALLVDDFETVMDRS